MESRGQRKSYDSAGTSLQVLFQWLKQAHSDMFFLSILKNTDFPSSYLLLLLSFSTISLSCMDVSIDYAFGPRTRQILLPTTSPVSHRTDSPDPHFFHLHPPTGTENKIRLHAI